MIRSGESSDGGSSPPLAPIAHVLLIDFHHTVGPVVEAAVPPIPGAREAPPPNPGGYLQLPALWRHLAFFGLPDGAHRMSEGGTVAFTVPPLGPATQLDRPAQPLYASAATPGTLPVGVETLSDAPALASAAGEQTTTGPSSEPGISAVFWPSRRSATPQPVMVVHNPLFGLSCFRQMASADLLHRPAEVTRGVVQKAVCVLMRVPCYGHVRQKTEDAARRLFAARDFRHAKEILAELHASLNAGLASRITPLHLTHCSRLALDLQSRGELLLRVWKLAIMPARVFVTSQDPCAVSEFVAHCALLVPGLLPAFPKAALVDPPVVSAMRSSRSCESLSSLLPSARRSSAGRPATAEASAVGDEDASASADGGARRSIDVSFPPKPSRVQMLEDPSSVSAPAAGAPSGLASGGPWTLQRLMSLEVEEQLQLPAFNLAHGFYVQPYLPLQYAELLFKDPHWRTARGCIIGSANPLHVRQPPRGMDVVVDLDSRKMSFPTEKGERDAHEWRSAARLTEADEDFLDDLRTVLRETVGDAAQAVSPEWADETVWRQFRQYYLSFLAAALRVHVGDPARSRRARLAQHLDASNVREGSTASSRSGDAERSGLHVDASDASGDVLDALSQLFSGGRPEEDKLESRYGEVWSRRAMKALHTSGWFDRVNLWNWSAAMPLVPHHPGEDAAAGRALAALQHDVGRMFGTLMVVPR
jgi:hypothetical protein